MAKREIDNLKITSRSQQESGSSRRCTARPRYEEINLAFLPEEKRAFIELLGRIQEAKEQACWIVAHYDDFARLFDTIIAVKSKLDIHNGAVALRVMADLAMERLVEMEKADLVERGALERSIRRSTWFYFGGPFARRWWRSMRDQGEWDPEFVRLLDAQIERLGDDLSTRWLDDMRSAAGSPTGS